ncbi:MAG TPA: OFA family MFS transporter [Chthoniobacteraceae bacterium]|nr:OFA family MFS transporter [Chthoniobacteraceae bacterium]
MNRWTIAVAGVVMQIALGAVYAWSVFRIPLHNAYGWSISQITMAFEVAILVLGFAAFAGGLWMRRTGPRTVGIVAGICYGAGTILAGRTGGSLPMLYLCYGLLGGAGVGLGYIIPVATLIKWFPDRRGMITGIAVAGFGAGALITAPIAARLIASVGLPSTFMALGIAYLIAVTGAALFMKNPPENYKPAGWEPPAVEHNARATKDYTLGEAMHTWQWYALWGTLFLNTLAGISIISQASPMAQEISGVTALVAAGMVSAISVANGAGRFLWAWLSDFIGRRTVFLVMFLLQAVLFVLLSHTQNFTSLTALAFVVILCYGGGFGTMPAFAADFFGSRNIGSIYGLMLTAWGFAGVVGPALIANIRQQTGHYQNALNVIAGIMLLSAVLPMLVHAPHEPKEKPHPPLPGQPKPRAI